MKLRMLVAALSLCAVAADAQTIKEQALAKLRAQQAAQAAAASSPAKTTTSLTLDVRNLATGGKLNDTWRTDYGSYSRDTQSRRSIECSVSLFSSEPKTVRLFCWFFGDKDVRVELGKSEKALDFSKSGVQKATFDCSSEKHTDHYAILGEHYEKGYTVRAWIVQAYVDGQLMAWKASDNSSTVEARAKRLVALDADK